MTSSYRFVVAGRVQGVGFREATRRTARRLGLCGWVRNRQDGCVEGLVGGAAPAIDEFRRWLNAGPPSARVIRVTWSGAEVNVDEAQEFRVER